MNNNPQETVNKVINFLNLPEFKIVNLGRKNVGSYNKMDKETRNHLINHYKPYNQKLANFLEEKLDWNI